MQSATNNDKKIIKTNVNSFVALCPENNLFVVSSGTLFDSPVKDKLLYATAKKMG